jgi:peroxiredoxin
MAKRLPALLTLGGLLAVLSGHAPSRADKAAPDPVGLTVANFTLPDPAAKAPVSLADFKDKKAVVIVFLGTECPVNNAYLPRLAELHKEYAAKGVQLLGVNPNTQDSAARVAEHAKKFEVPFPVLKDENNALADRLGAKRTPEAFLLDAAGTVRYHGRVDDQFGIGYQRPRPTRRDLAEALDEVLAGKAVSRPTAAVSGCLIGRVVQARADGPVTYAKHVSRVLQKHCQECHRPGQIGPMPLLTYDDARAWSPMIREVVSEGRMPPWYADPRHGRFVNDRRLPPEEKDALLKWIAEGCPKGDDKDLPPPREFYPGWLIGKPDLILAMEEEVRTGKAVGEGFDVPAETPPGGVPYQYFRVKTNFKEDRWVQYAEARPGAPAVVHHIIAFINPPGQTFFPGRPGSLLCGMAPGDTSLHLPDGVAKRVPAGSELIFQLHYTPNGKAQKDKSSVGLIFAKQPPQREALTIPVANPTFRIPPGANHHEVEAWFPFREDGHILGFMPHMHVRGKDFLYEAVHADGTKETLLSVPRYHFAWQNYYNLAKPYPMPKGSKIHCVAHFDNSDKNPNNPDPAVEVRWGDQTWEEMMIGWTDIMFDRKPK